MKYVFCVLAILFGTCAPTSAQTGVTGTWDVPGRPGARMVLVQDGPVVRGGEGGFEIFDGRIDGNTITFKWKSPDGDRIMTVTGRINGDEIAFTREVQVREGGDPGGTGFSGAGGPTKFIAKRVTEAALRATSEAAARAAADQVSGVDLAAAVNLVKQDVKVEGTLFVPQKVSRVRAVIVAVNWGLGQTFYRDPQVRKLLETTESGLLLAKFSNVGPSAQYVANRFNADGADGLVLLLQRLAQESGHQELADAPLLLWGHSAGGAFDSTFAAGHPQRTIAFVGYHSGSAGSGDMKALSQLSQIPALLLAGGKDTSVPLAAVQIVWNRGRSIGAPWTFAVDPDATHGDEEYLKKANDIVIPWITAVLRQRLSPDGATLRAVTDGSAWMGNNRTGEVAPSSTFAGSKPEASWLPDEPSARGWQAVRGAVK